MTGLDGERALTGVRLADGSAVAATGVFVQDGRSPRPELADGVLARSGDGLLVADTGVPGVFAAGLVRSGVSDHVVSAAADGLAAGPAAVAHVRGG